MAILFQSVTVLPMDGGRNVLRDAFVAVEGERITHVGPTRPAGDFERVVDCAGLVMLPGFVNAHTHLPMTLMRGYGGGCDLHTWLNDYIFPAEARLDDKSVAAGTALGLAEMIASGVTCVADMYDHCDAIIGEILKAGLSANIARGVTLFTDDYSFDSFPGCVETQDLTRRWNGYNNGQIQGGRLRPRGVHLPSRPVEGHGGLGQGEQSGHARPRVRDPLGAPGVPGALGQDSHSGAGRVRGVGLRRALAAHCVYTTPEDWAIMKEKHISCVHNPWSNLKLGSGVAPIPAMVKAGVNVALGTDGMSSHNSADFFSDIKLAAVLHNGVGEDPSALSAWDALEMATVRGAAALGRTDTGVIAPGRWPTSFWWTLPPPTSPPATTRRRTWSLPPTAPTWP